MSADSLPFPDLSAEKIEQIVQAPTFTNPKRRFGVVTRPLANGLEVSLVHQEHLWLDKKKVYGYLRQLHPYPEVRGRALAEVNNADSALFDIYRIPKPGHCPAGLQGVVYDLPVGVTNQSPLSLELVGKGKEIIIEEWPPSHPKIPSESEDLSPREQQHRLQLEGPPQVDEDDDDMFSDLLLQDAQEIIPSPVRGEKEKGEDQTTTATTNKAVDVASSLGGMIDDLQDELAQGDEQVELYEEPEIFADDLGDELSSPPPVDVSLPPMCIEEFVLPSTESPRLFQVKNNGTIRFVMVFRKKGEFGWKISPWSMASQVINGALNACYKDNMYCLKAFQWSNPWRGTGLVSLYSSIKYVEIMRQFRQLFSEVELDDYPDLEFNSYPRDLVPSTKVSILLKTALKNFEPKHIPTALFRQNAGLSGSLKLHSVKPVSFDSHGKKKKGELRTGWRIAILRGNQTFFDSIKKFPESYPFPLGCAHVHIRGGVGRIQGFGSGRSQHPMSSSSSSPSPASSAGAGLASVVVAGVSQSSIVLDSDELSSILHSQIPSASVSSSSGSGSSGIVAAAMAAASVEVSNQQSQRSQQQQQQQQHQHQLSSQQQQLRQQQQQPPQQMKTVKMNARVMGRNNSSSSTGLSSAQPNPKGPKKVPAPKGATRGRGRGFNRGKKAESKKSVDSSSQSSSQV